MKICEMMGISKPTLYSYVREAQEASKEQGSVALAGELRFG
ncbi:hypothetical protein [Nitrosococcus watsonii]